MKNKIINQRGSIALISILIISAVVLILVLSMSDINMSTSYQYLNTASNKTVYYTAEACLEETIIRLEDDDNFTGTTIIFNDDTNCTITVSGTDIELVVNYLNYSQNYSAEISKAEVGEANNVQLLNWHKI